MHTRPEQIGDHDLISNIILAAFAAHLRSQHNEQAIVVALRIAQALTVSLVAVEGNEIVGHIACSPVSIDGKASNWFGLGPLSVRPDRQGKGMGAALVRAAIEQLKTSNAEGILLLGNPRYYRCFGFAARADLILPGAPANHFLSLSLRSSNTRGVVTYHVAFEAR